MIRVALDIGASYSKLVVLKEGRQMTTRLIKTEGFEETACLLLRGAKRQFEFEEAIVTGGGSTQLPSTLEDISIKRVDEIKAIGTGGLKLTGLNEAIVVSMGTGTAITHATLEKVTHLGGTGVGGGTLIGLGKLLIGETNPQKLEKLALKGDNTNIDLTVGDLYPKGIGNLSPQATASNLAKIGSDYTMEDLSSAIHNLVGQTMGIVISLTAKLKGIEDVVLVGTCTKNKCIVNIVRMILGMRKLRSVVPEKAEFAIAYGAILAEKR
jgi:type II pantothenate kinase